MNNSITPTRGAIQPIGFHLSLSESWLVTAASANLGSFVPVAAPDALGQPITGVISDDAIHDIRNRMTLLRGDGAIEHLFHCPLSDPARPFDLAIYRDGGGFSIDAEPCNEHAFGNAAGIVTGMLARIAPSLEVGPLCDVAAHQLRALTGFEQVVVLADGEVLGQSSRAGASRADFATVAAIGADLAIVDCDAAPVDVLALEPDETVGPGSTLRYPTPAEQEAMAAVGARAALTLPLSCEQKPWGKVACFHPTPRHVSAERRSIARLFACIISLRTEIAQLRAGN